MKNPWLSLWLSAANSAAGTARAFWTAQARRRQKELAKEAVRSLTGERAPTAKRRATTKRRTKGTR